MLTSNENKGFAIQFTNRYTLSVQFGHGNYCDNRYQQDEMHQNSSKNAEVALFTPEGEISEVRYITGYIPTRKVCEAIGYGNTVEVVVDGTKFEKEIYDILTDDIRIEKGVLRNRMSCGEPQWKNLLDIEMEKEEEEN